MIKILYYTTSYHANHGGSIQSIEFYENLKANPEVSEFLFPDTKVDKVISAKKFNNFKEYIKRSGVFQMISFYRRNSFYFEHLVKRIEDVRPDVIIFQMDSNFLQIEKIKAKFPKLLICAQINGSPFDEFYGNIIGKNHFIKKQQNSYAKTDLNFFISEFSRSRVMGEQEDASRDKIVYNGTNIEKFYPIQNQSEIRKKYNYPLKNFIIGYIGTLDFHKKMLRLLEAFKDLSEKYKDISLVIIGDGPALPKIKAYISKHQLEDKILIKGWIKHESVNEHLNTFDLAVHHYANHYMNPLKIFEYLASGVPVIAPDIPSVRQNFKENIDLVISKNDNKDLASEMENIMNDHMLRKALSSNKEVLRNIAENFTWEAYTRRIVSEIKSKISLQS